MGSWNDDLGGIRKSGKCLAWRSKLIESACKSCQNETGCQSSTS